jgi:hypothetical protein
LGLSILLRNGWTLRSNDHFINLIMVKLTKTELISEAIAVFNEKISPEDSIVKPLSTESSFVTHNLLGKLALGLNSDEYTFTKLLTGTQIYIPSKPEKKTVCEVVN